MSWRRLMAVARKELIQIGATRAAWASCWSCRWR